MRILAVMPRPPYPPLKGDQVVAYHHLRLLGPRHRITVVTLVERDEDVEALEHVRPWCERIVTVRLPKLRSLAGVAARAPVSPLPLQILYYQSGKLSRAVRKCALDGRFDVAHGYMLRVAPYLEPLPQPRLLDVMDSMQLRLERSARAHRGPSRWLHLEELRRIRRYERTLVDRFDRITVVSSRDRELLGGGPVEVVPLGVDTEEFRPMPERRPEQPTIVFSGGMSYAPNVAAATWLTREILPRVLERRSGVRLKLVGARPSRGVRALGEIDGVEVTGYVASMVETLNEATVAVAPMVSGSGMQNKVLEAMACGLPTVATEIGLGSISAVPGEEIAVANDADGFARAIVNLLQHPEHARSLGDAGRHCVVREHSWRRSCDRVEAIWSELAESGRA